MERAAYVVSELDVGRGAREREREGKEEAEGRGGKKKLGRERIVPEK